ncbi:hypothetical protein PV08_03235 [Exophiala spinifera]|uniref:Zn(2)-C6 fungal-type domain-containing protein n=1 Tax=Exophiala spinifera TaxID=91928 RepID=A0A0D1YUM0_9EURO|nr:uncharacterized protein PV08_03235 [Exophiala spinifera]KIW18946.1 hypothetical protein PV08_03235 [Exophiala spinifera]
MPVQRPRETCTECSMRRQKCDRQIPCSRCVKRGIADKCTRQWPTQYDPSIHRVYKRSRPVASEGSGGSAPSSPAHQANTAPTAGSRLPQGLSDFAAYDTRWADEPRLQYNFTPTDALISRLRTRDPNTLPDKSWIDLNGIGFNSTEHAHSKFLQMLLPNVGHIWDLVNYHELCLLWYHGCYFGPLFRWELESVLADQDQKETLIVDGLDLQWLGLLFSIIAGSLTCAPERRLSQWGFQKAERSKLPMQWYKASISCLNQANYTSNHSIYAVHTIATLTMSAHSLGQSAELSVLLGGALKIAQSLGLDRLDYDASLDEITTTSTEEQRHRLIKREIGRRLWSQLCVQDWMSLPFNESYHIQPGHFTTTKPSNRNYLNMDPIPIEFPTYISYGNYLFEIAKLMVKHHEDISHATTQFTTYEHVLEYDSRMRTLATKGMPTYFHVVQPIDPAWPEWIPAARRSLTICFAHKMIMIHRAYIKQSFINPTYSMTRLTCLAAAKTILNEAKQTKDLDGPIIWVDKAFCIVAAIVLCLDLFHRPASDPVFDTHKELVSECIEYLRKFGGGVIAVRGANLLAALLTERNRVTSTWARHPEAIDMREILALVGAEMDGAVSPDDTHPRLLAELLPPQAGFCNRFIFENLFSFKNNTSG